MLFIGRKKGETLTFILEDKSKIIIKVINSDEQFGTDLAIEAPQNVKIWRGEYKGEKLLKNNDIKLITGE